MEGVILTPAEHGGRCWSGFEEGRWQRVIDVRDFIQRNVNSYTGDESFLVGPTARTQAVWAKLQPYFQDEQRKGVLDVDAAAPSTLLAHAAGYIDRDNEIIVGLQTDKPFRRAIFPAGGQCGARAVTIVVDALLNVGDLKARAQISNHDCSNDGIHAIDDHALLLLENL